MSFVTDVFVRNLKGNKKKETRKRKQEKGNKKKETKLQKGDLEIYLYLLIFVAIFTASLELHIYS
jgi:hypothetical protein